MLAGIERMDKDLTIAQMQVKVQAFNYEEDI